MLSHGLRFGHGVKLRSDRSNRSCGGRRRRKEIHHKGDEGTQIYFLQWNSKALLTRYQWQVGIILQFRSECQIL